MTSLPIGFSLELPSHVRLWVGSTMPSPSAKKLADSTESGVLRLDFSQLRTHILGSLKKRPPPLHGIANWLRARRSLALRVNFRIGIWSRQSVCGAASAKPACLNEFPWEYHCRNQSVRDLSPKRPIRFRSVRTSIAHRMNTS